MSFPTSGHRFLYANLITGSNATPVDVASGRVTQGTKEVSVGGAAGRAGGVYTGLTEIQVVVEIDNVSAGTSIGSGTYRVSYDGGSTWTASGQATSTSPVSLPSGSGLTFVWTAAVSGNDFAVGDRWKFKVVLPHGLAAGLDFQDLNRTFRFANATGTKTITIDHGTAVAADSFFLLSHNLTNAAVVHLQRHTADAWGAPDVDETITWASGKMGKFFASSSKRYSRITIVDASASPAPEGKPYLGVYLELTSRKLSHVPWDQHAEWYGAKSVGPYGYKRASVETRVERFPLNYGRISSAEYDQLLAMRNAVWDTTGGVYTPILFIPDYSAPATVYACCIEDFGLRGAGPTGYAGQLVLEELVKVRTA